MFWSTFSVPRTTERTERDSFRSSLQVVLSASVLLPMTFQVLTVICLFSITSVGATQHVKPEVAVSRFFSGGGFSDYVRCVTTLRAWSGLQLILHAMIQFSRPSYQDDKVGAYMKTISEGAYAGLYNPYVHLVYHHKVTINVFISTALVECVFSPLSSWLTILTISITGDSRRFCPRRQLPDNLPVCTSTHWRHLRLGPCLRGIRLHAQRR